MQRPAITTKAIFSCVARKYGSDTVFYGEQLSDRYVHATSIDVRDGSRMGADDKHTRSSGGVAITTDANMSAVFRRQAGGASVALLDDPPTVAEVARCKPGNALDLNRLSNDWYRDNAKLLVPILTTLFNRWWVAGVVPRFFSSALVA